MYYLFTTIILLTIPSTSGVKLSITFLKTAEDAAILRQCGLKGRWTFFWAKIVVFGWTFTALSVELLQVASFSRGSVATLLLLLAIVVAFKSLATSLIYCWYLYNTRLANDLAAWKELIDVIGDATVAIMISLPLADLLW
ncbi:hypothetical protein EIP86_008817 [Pleurotus ostreatoroseus]|nr:hypothetical protein EIP86_008817 [Pleurotus ostreatoroseus]